MDGWMKRGFGIGIGGNGVNALGWAWSENRGGNRKRKRNTTGACSVGVADVRVATGGSDSLSGRVVQPGSFIAALIASWHVVGELIGAPSIIRAWFGRSFFALDHYRSAV
jgi:hypothetical protein